MIGANTKLCCQRTTGFSALQKVDYLAKIFEEAVADVSPLKKENKSQYKIPKIIKNEM